MFSTKTAQFAWKNISVMIGGRPIAGLTDIEYKVEKEFEEIYGAGQYAQFLGEGNKKFSGTVEMLQGDYELLVEEARKLGGTDITDMEVSITVSYIPSINTTLKTITDHISGVRFTDSSKKISQGETHMKVSLPFIALSIEPQI